MQKRYILDCIVRLFNSGITCISSLYLLFKMLLLVIILIANTL